MLIIMCDECGEPAKSLQLRYGYAEFPGKMGGVLLPLKATTVDLCENHWPEEGATQPNNCNRVNFVWAEGGPPDPPFIGPVSTPRRSSNFVLHFFEEGYDGPVFKIVKEED